MSKGTEKPEPTAKVESIEPAEIITMGDIFAAREALDRLVGQHLPFKLSYRLAKFARKFDAEYAIVFKARNDLIIKLGEDKDGLFHVKADNVKEFNESQREIMETVSTMNAAPIKFFPADIEGMSISAVDLILLDKFIEVVDDAGDAPAE